MDGILAMIGRAGVRQFLRSYRKGRV